MDLREQQKAWLQDILSRSGETATEIARRAGVSSSTLTRFLNSAEAETALSLRTVAKVERVARILLGAECQAPGPVASQPSSGFSEHDAALYLSGEDEGLDAAIRALSSGRNGVDPWIMKSRALETAGVLPGDILLVDLNGTPRAGDVVYAQVYDWRSMTAETIVRLYEPPFLVAASLEPKLRRPLLVDSNNVVIKGVMLAMIRPRLPEE